MAETSQIRLTELSGTTPTTVNTSTRTSLDGEAGTELEQSARPPTDRKVAEGELAASSSV